MLARDEILDWLAAYEVDPWGESRADLRAAVQSLHIRGCDFERLPMVYPYHQVETELTAEEEIELIAEIEAQRQREQEEREQNHATA